MAAETQDSKSRGSHEVPANLRKLSDTGHAYGDAWQATSSSAHFVFLRCEQLWRLFVEGPFSGKANDFDLLEWDFNFNQFQEIRVCTKKHTQETQISV